MQLLKISYKKLSILGLVCLIFFSTFYLVSKKDMKVLFTGLDNSEFDLIEGHLKEHGYFFSSNVSKGEISVQNQELVSLKINFLTDLKFKDFNKIKLIPSLKKSNISKNLERIELKKILNNFLSNFLNVKEIYFSPFRFINSKRAPSLVILVDNEKLSFETIDQTVVMLSRFDLGVNSGKILFLSTQGKVLYDYFKLPRRVEGAFLVTALNRISIIDKNINEFWLSEKGLRNQFTEIQYNLKKDKFIIDNIIDSGSVFSSVEDLNSEYLYMSSIKLEKKIKESVDQSNVVNIDHEFFSESERNYFNSKKSEQRFVSGFSLKKGLFLFLILSTLIAFGFLFSRKIKHSDKIMGFSINNLNKIIENEPPLLVSSIYYHLPLVQRIKFRMKTSTQKMNAIQKNKKYAISASSEIIEKSIEYLKSKY